MAIKTGILYCDSTVNPIVGCNGEGCELMQSSICYAQTLVNRYAGRPSWPETFTKPAYFPERLGKAIKWPDLTGLNRPDKPWLNGYPRVIFLNDLSDTFTKSAPQDWLVDFFYEMEESPHIWLLLTKQPAAMVGFFRRMYVPKNFWLGTTVTSRASVYRAYILSTIKSFAPDAKLWLSIEPLLDLTVLPDDVLHNTDWVALGGASGPNAPLTKLVWLELIVRDCEEKGVPLFVKQLGARWAQEHGSGGAKGEDWDTWPEELRERQMPKL